MVAGVSDQGAVAVALSGAGKRPDQPLWGADVRSTRRPDIGTAERVAAVCRF